MDYKADFPIFQVHPDLVYLDNAATTHKPKTVVDAIQHFYTQENATINRGLYPLGAHASRKYQAVRKQVAEFLNAASAQEIVFTSGTTDSINLVAQSFVLPKLNAGDEVLVTAMEHHANLIPWQQACQQSGAKLKIAPILDDGTLDLAAFEALLSPNTRFISVVHISNTLGTINPIEKVIKLAKSQKHPIPILIDAAQSAAHYDLNVQQLDCDFLVFSGHKVYGPTGVGVLYAKTEHLETMQPIRFGGDIIERVTYEQATFAKAPGRFEAGTPNVAGIIGLGVALDYIKSLDQKVVHMHLNNLKDLATQALQTIDDIVLVGTAKNKSAILSFNLRDVHPHDVASFLGAENIAIRAGHHCTQPLMDAWGFPGTVRASFAVYNTEKDINKLVETLVEVQAFFK
ncbi:MAG: cysteine desulfurase [Saprospiraceae bacterium]